ncbi:MULTISPECIES: hypothetical protein [Nocardia]|uniref:hypothetical protein n=1 Tax=Nocardia TaxID=1817 RepID=UPI001C12BE99|nr:MULTISPECIES: hypothetical protein [Nocardia]UEX20842.1 hypothetical protein LMJ57_17610 [Nocardia farcinica]
MRVTRAANHWDKDLLTALSRGSHRVKPVLEVVFVNGVRRALLDGRITLPKVGAVREGVQPSLPYRVVDDAGREIEAFSRFLRDMALTDASPLTGRSYGHDLLRWWRLVRLVEVGWERATRAEVELLVGWMRIARNPQRVRKGVSAGAAGSVNLRTGKPTLGAGYAPATVNHALSVLSAFYTFHMHFGRGPLVNPVPVDAARRQVLAHRSPIEPNVRHRRAPLRQKSD